jgi:iron complex transport system substrate-binding protein
MWAEERIIPLAPAVNEILYALDKGENIVGNTTYATYPKESQTKPKVGGYFSVSLEKIVALKPSLVLMQKNNLSLKPKLEKLGIKTEFIKISSLKDIKDGIQKIATLTQSEDKAIEIVKSIDKAVKKSQGILKDKKILIVFGRQFDLKKEVYVSGNNIYFADIIKASGNKNAYEENSTKQPTLSYEGILACNPDIIYILSHTVTKQEDAKKMIKPWLELPVTASKAKTIYVTTKKYAGMPSQRVVYFIQDFKEVLEDAKSKLSKLQD